MFKKMIFSSLIILSVIFIHCHVYCATASPEQAIQEFYSWYFKADSGKNIAEENDEIFNFVEKDLVTYIRKSHGETYYFTQVSSYSSDWEKVKVAPRKYTKINNIYIVPVDFHLSSRTFTVLVYLKEKGSRLLITKVSDIYPGIACK